MMDLKKIHMRDKKGRTTAFTLIYDGGCGIKKMLVCVGRLHLSESTVQIELPPIKVVDIEREVIVFSTVTGVGQNIPATFGKAQKYVSETKYMCTLGLSNQVPLKVNEQKCATDPALRNSSLTMFFKGTQIRRGNFLNRRCGNCPNSCTTHKSGYQHKKGGEGG